MKEWYKGIELVDIDGMPNSNHAIATKAKRNKWLRRKAAGQGSALEYHISCFHEDIQKILYGKHSTLLDHEYYGDTYSPKVAEAFKQSALDYIHTYDLLPVAYDESNQPSEKLPATSTIASKSKTTDIPEFTVQSAAKAGCLTNQKLKTGIFTVSSDLGRNLNLDMEQTAIIFCPDESMLPTINDGDRVLVDTQPQRDPVKDGIYVIQIDDMAYIKRIKWNILKQSYQVISDNLEHETFEMADNNLERLKIIGRAAMVMKSL